MRAPNKKAPAASKQTGGWVETSPKWEQTADGASAFRCIACGRWTSTGAARVGERRVLCGECGNSGLPSSPRGRRLGEIVSARAVLEKLVPGLLRLDSEREPSRP